jgi:glycosyltransferase involved in cell wall biosynthesis
VTSEAKDPNVALLSVVIPVFDEQEVIELAHARVVQALAPNGEFDLEIVYVNDGSRDRSARILGEIAEKDPRVCVVSFARNFGHQAAITAGLRYAAGDVVAILDADLQDPPEVILDMLAKWREGYSVVYGIRQSRKEPLLKRICYDGFYRLLSGMSDFPIPKDSGDFCLLDRRVVDLINALPEKNRFVRGLRAWCGGRQYGLTYQRAARAAGHSKYSLRRLIRLALDGIFNFSTFPLRLIFWMGMSFSILALAGLLFFLAMRVIGFEFFGHRAADVPGFTTVVLSIFLLSGVQLLSIGVLGEYLGRMYAEIKGRPTYLADQVRESRYRRSPAAG